VNLTDHTNLLETFTDTAALLTQLHLVISVDTGLVHLAGAMGIPCWVLLPFVPDWRWGTSGDRQRLVSFAATVPSDGHRPVGTGLTPRRRPTRGTGAASRSAPAFRLKVDTHDGTLTIIRHSPETTWTCWKD
jgi:hypothetical protein